LNRIRDAWIEFKKVPRTETPEGSIVFDLVDPAGELTGQVKFPDLPGESFNHQWTERTWSADFDAQVREADGFLLFVSPDYSSRTLISEAMRRIPKRASARASGTAPQTERKWDSRAAPTQSKLVEVLQFLADTRELRGPSSVAIVVSAWDRAERQTAADGTQARRPEAWVRAHLPLLWQYVTANPDLFRTRWYGVSAQGGDLNAPEELVKLQSFGFTSERIRVVEEDGDESHDPTRPLRWLLEQARSAS
jgi:hypothetical protein